MRRWAILLTVLVLAGCHKKAADASADDAATPAAAVQATNAKASAAPPGVPLAQIAYDYIYRLSLPSARIQALYDWHQQACAVAGPAVCQVIGASMQRSGKDVVSAHLELRATPDWINHFRGGLDGEAQAAGGQVEAANTAAEDLTRAMVDNQAALHAKTRLRNRLEKEVETRSGKISDAVEADKAAAEVQGEIDTQRAELAAEKTRVATSKLTLDYQPIAGLAPPEAQRALGGAFSGFLGHSMMVFSALVTTFSYLLPIGLAGGLIAWLAFALNRRTRNATVRKADDRQD